MKKVLFLFVALIASIFLGACSSSDHDRTNLRVLHASPDAPAVDILLDGNKIVSNAPFKAATAFNRIDSGKRNIKVNAAGTSTTVIDATPTLLKDRFYTVIAANNLAAIEPIVIDEDGIAPAAGKLKVRVVHGAPKAPNVDVYVTAPADDIAPAGVAPTLSNVPFKTVSSTLEVDAATYRIRVTPAGAKTVVFDSGSVPLAAGANLILVAVEQNIGTSPISLIGLTRDPATPKIEIADINAQIRVMHASPDAPAVDVLVDNAVALANVAYPANSDYLPIAAGPHNLKVNAAGTPTTVINATPTLDATKAYSVYAVNFLANIEPLVVVDNLAPPDAGKAKIRVIHGSPNAPAVDVLANNAVVVPNVSFKAASDYLSVAPGAYNFKINLAGTATTATQADVTLAAGKIYTAIAIGSAAANAANPLQIKLLTDK